MSGQWQPYPSAPEHGPSGQWQAPDPRAARAQEKARKAHGKAMRPWYAKKRWLLSMIVGALVAVMIASSALGGDSEPEPAAATPGDAAPADAGGTPTQDVYAIDQVAHTGDFDVTVHTVEDPYAAANQLETPAAGQRFVAVEATITNTGTEPQAFSTLAGAEVTDHLDRPWAPALAGYDRPQLDAATVAPGEARRGWIVFGVANDATDLTLRVKGNLTANGSLFDLG